VKTRLICNEVSRSSAATSSRDLTAAIKYRKPP
jgi:hypothetical protein